MNTGYTVCGNCKAIINTTKVKFVVDNTAYCCQHCLEMAAAIKDLEEIIKGNNKSARN